MIKHDDFIHILRAVLHAFDKSIVVEEGSVSSPKNIHLIDKIQGQIKDKKFVVIEEVSSGIQLKFKNNDGLFLIKKTDFKKADPPIYFKQGSKWALEFKTSSIILLTDLALYIYQNATHKRLENNLNGLDNIYKQFKALCRDVDCFSELWMHTKLNCLALVDRVEEKIYFVSDTAEHMYLLDGVFPAETTKNVKKEKPVNVPDFLLDAVIKNDDLYAKVKIEGYAEPVDVIFETEEKKEDFFEEAAFCKRIISKLTLQKQEQLLKHVAEEITDAAFAQSDKIKGKQSSTDELLKDLKIVQLIFIEEDILVNIRSQQIFPNKEIIVQLDEKLSIVDITIPELSTMR